MLGMLDSQIFTRIKTQFPEKVKKKYPDLKFTNSDRADTNPKFPTVYVHQMGSMEQAQDLSGENLNAVLATYQIEVSTNTKQSEAQDVMSYIVKIMKKMRFSIIAMPEFQNTTSVYRSVARFRRMIGENDIL